MKGFVPTKQKILNSIKMHREHEVTFKQLASEFTISETAVRKHLQELIQQAYIYERTIKQDIGRPYHLYSLTSKGHRTFPNQDDELPLQLLQDLEEVGGKAVIDELLLKRKEREQEELAKQLEEESFQDKVKKLTDMQNERGYMMEYAETETGDYELTNYNCPIYNIASCYDQICTNEKNMLTNIFPKSDVDFHSCIATGGKFCGWHITHPQNKIKDSNG